MKKGYEASSMTIEQLSMAIVQLKKERHDLSECICSLIDELLRGGNVRDQLDLANRAFNQNSDTLCRLYEERALKRLAAIGIE